MAVYVYKDGKFELIGDVEIEFLKGTEEYKDAVLVEVDKKIETVEDYSRIMKKSISQITDSYINQKLSELDEDLADLTSESQVIGGKILYLSAKEGVSITTDEVKQKIALFIAGSYIEDDAVKELQEKGLSDETIQEILPLLQRGVEIAKILNWKEEIWKAEAELEEQVDSMTLEELLQLDVKKLCEDTYNGIPLEV